MILISTWSHFPMRHLYLASQFGLLGIHVVIDQPHGVGFFAEFVILLLSFHFICIVLSKVQYKQTSWTEIKEIAH